MYTAKDFMQEWGKEYRDQIDLSAHTAVAVEKQINAAVTALGLHWE